MSNRWTRSARVARCGALAAVVCGSLAAAAGAATPGSATEQGAQTGLVARTVLSGSAHGWSDPDDVTSVGKDIYVGFQNGVPATGGGTGTPTESTVVKFRLDGTIEATWQLVGKCDGLTADTGHGMVIATVNEDGNSSLYTLPAHGSAAATRYTYDANPLPHGGGTDSITIDHGQIYIAASNPNNPGGPAIYQITLHAGIAHLQAAPFFDSSAATVANTRGEHPQVNLALTDPDSSTVVPSQGPRFADDFMLDSQGDEQEIFAAHLGMTNQALQVLNISQSVDDTAFATARHGGLIAADAFADSVVLITGTFTLDAAYTAVTPGNANNAGPNPPPNYLGVIDLNSGVVSPVTTTGVAFQPHSLIFVRTG